MKTGLIALGAGALIAVGLAACVPGGGGGLGGFGGGGGTIEYATDRPGSDYNNFDLAVANPNMCRSACQSDPVCRAWTYVNPGIQGPSARCWLKSAVPAPISNSNTVSGVK